MIAIATWRRADPAGDVVRRLAHGDVEALLTRNPPRTACRSVAKQEERRGHDPCASRARRASPPDSAWRRCRATARSTLRAGSFAGTPASNRVPSAAGRSSRASPPSACTTPRAAPACSRASLANASVFLRYSSCDRAVARRCRHTAAAIAGCASSGPSSAAPTASAASSVADLAERDDRVVLQRTVELGDLADRSGARIARVVAERLDDRAAEQILAARDQRQQRRRARADRRRRPRARASAPDARTRSCSRSSADEQRRQHGGIRMMLEPPVRDDAQAIVAVARSARASTVPAASPNPVSSTSAR